MVNPMVTPYSNMNPYQRLNYLEQQFPQFQQPQQSQNPSYPAYPQGVQGIPQQTYPQQIQPIQPIQSAQPQQAQPSSGFIKGRAVTSLDEARASIIDFDGSVFVFTDLANGKIYTKQINLDGTATLNTYTLDTQNPTQNVRKSEDGIFIQREEFDQFKAKINGQLKSLSNYLSTIDSILGGNGNESTAVVSNDDN